MLKSYHNGCSSFPEGKRSISEVFPLKEQLNTKTTEAMPTPQIKLFTTWQSKYVLINALLLIYTALMDKLKAMLFVDLLNPFLIIRQQPKV